MGNKIYKYQHCPSCGSKWDDGNMTGRLIADGVCETVEEARHLIEEQLGYSKCEAGNLAYTRLTHISIKLADGMILAHYMCPDCGQFFFENGVPIHPDRN